PRPYRRNRLTACNIPSTFLELNAMHTKLQNFFLYGYAVHHVLHSFPTRRSSDLRFHLVAAPCGVFARVNRLSRVGYWIVSLRAPDRKSTRLNSSHLVTSYAVFCLKKKSIRTLSSRSLRRFSIGS